MGGTRPPTKRQAAVLAFIRDALACQGRSPTIREIADQFEISPPGVWKHLRALEAKGLLSHDRYQPRGLSVPGLRGTGASVEIPILGRVAAGQPILAQENLQGTVAVDRDLARGRSLFALRVKGDSMIGDHITEGDLVVVRSQADAEDGEIVVALVADEATVKRLKRERGGIALLPSNPSYRPIRLLEGGPEVRVLGKVIALVRRYR